jgi:hypothetical protein
MSRLHCRIYPDLWHLNGQIHYGAYKRGSPPPQLIWSLHWLENTLNQSFLSSNSLSLSLSSFKQIQALLERFELILNDLSIFKQSTSPTISVCLLLLRIHPLDRLGILQEPQRLWWALKSLYCPLIHGDLIVKNWTRSWWLFDEVWDWERPYPLWAPQRRRW